jgi:tyrosinase
MKTLFTVHNFSFVVAFFLITLTVFKTIDNKNADLKSRRIVFECLPTSDNTVIDTPFVRSDTIVRIRKNIDSLSTKDINSIRAGVSAMKALPLSDPTSWGYQAAIHGTTATNNLQSWNMCQHRTRFFFSWHRMYLYFFERILRAKSGNPNLTVPYWNYQLKAVLPATYRSLNYTDSSGIRKANPLYDGSRYSSINDGGALPSSISTSINNSLNYIPFYTYQSNLENPHGAVHTSIGGNMRVYRNAAKDPIFYLHHGNIDRLWEVWLRRCGGRVNPTASDTTWWNQRYTFFDEKKRAVVMTGAQIVKTAAQLSYRYQGLSDTVKCAAARIDESKVSSQTWNLITVPSVLRLNQNNLNVSLSKAKRDSLDRFLTMTSNRNSGSAKEDKYDQLIVSVEIFKINKAPEGVIEVYLNLPPNETPNSNSKSFVGILDLFTASAHVHHSEEGNNINKIDATTAAKALDLDLANLGNAQLTFVVRGNTLPNGKEVKTNSDVQLGNINISAKKGDD